MTFLLKVRVALTLLQMSVRHLKSGPAAPLTRGVAPLKPRSPIHLCLKTLDSGGKVAFTKNLLKSRKKLVKDRKLLPWREGRSGKAFLLKVDKMEILPGSHWLLNSHILA
jgi:hypothetical protein